MTCEIKLINLVEYCCKELNPKLRWKKKSETKFNTKIPLKSYFA